MGKLKTNILDAASGKIGPVVVYEMYGNTYIRSKPSGYNDRKSTPQLIQRQKMTLVNRFLKSFSKLIKITFAHEAKGRSAFSAAKSFNLKKAIDGTYPDQFINPEKAVLSTGTIILPDHIQMTQQEQGLLFEWDPPYHPQASSLDTLVVIAREREHHLVKYRLTGAQRSDQSYFWPMDLFNYGTIDVWAAFRSYKEDDMSESIYLGTI